MRKTAGLFLLTGLMVTLFTACSPKVAESTTSSSNGSSGSSSSSAPSNGFSGEGRHTRDPKLPPAEKYFKRPETSSPPMQQK